MELYYNPERMSETEVKETFVANQWLVDEILSILKRQPKGAGVQHVIIIAPRGMGKTTLLLMLRFSVLESELAQSWQPVLFPEESYAVYDLADFWLSGLGHLAIDTDDEELSAKISQLQRTHQGSSELEEAALATIKDWRSENQKQLLMLVDSLDIILNQIGDERDNAKLRDALMNDGTMMLIGGGTTFFKEARAYDQPLYNFFKRYDLQTLNSDQIHELLRRRAKLDAVEDFDEILRRNASRIRVLEYFTGGNPRLVMMLYRVIMRSEVSEVKRGIEKLLDEVTPYYKAKIESLPPQQRKILDHIARISSRTREGLTPTEIAASTRLPPNQVSSQLKRLADLGYVRAANVRGRSSYYTLSEPLYAIWHQMRFGREARERMNWLVSFLKGWYNPEELNFECARLQTSFHEYLAAGQLTEARDALEYRGYLLAALNNRLAGLEITQDQTASPSNDQLRQAVLAEANENVELGRLAWTNKHREDALKHFRRAVELNPTSPLALFSLAATLTATGNTEEALLRIEAAEQSVPRESELVNALRALRGALEQDFEKVENNLSRVSPSSGGTLIWFFVGLLFRQSSNLDAALKSFCHVTDLDRDYAEGWYWQASTFHALGRYEEALASVGTCLRLKPDSYEAFRLRGLSLVKLGNDSEAVRSFDRALELNPNGSKTWYSRGLSLIALNRNEEALNSMQKACELTPDYYEAFVGISLTLANLGRLHEADLSLDAALKIEPDSFDALYLRGLILAANNNGENLARIFKPVFSLSSDAHAVMRDSAWVQLMKFLVSLEEQDLAQAKKDWLKFNTYGANTAEEKCREVAAMALRDLAESGHWEFVRELIGDSSSHDPFFPLARALDYFATVDAELIEKLSPEVRKIVEEIVDTLEKSAPKNIPRKRKAVTAKRKRA